MVAEGSEQNRGIKARIINVLRSAPPRKTLRKRVTSNDGAAGGVPVIPVAPLQAHREKYKELSTAIDSQLGERRDHTELLHTIGRNDPFDSEELPPEEKDLRPPGEELIASLSPELWRIVMGYLDPIDATYLALSNRTLYRRLGSGPWEILNRHENYRYKVDFLITLDRHLPHHLLCFACATYHSRTQAGNERLMPANFLNPLFDCPNSRNAVRPPSRLRITPGRNLPFWFVQLCMRAHRFSPAHGIPLEKLSRRWKQDGWSYTTRFHIHQGHLLMRVVSTTFAPPQLTPSGMRLLLYSRDDYMPHFSVCAHWKHSRVLIDVCKCALGHIPAPRETDGFRGVEHRFRDHLAGREYNPNAIVSQCGECRPMRRCPACPTEYLVEVKLAEEKTNPRRLMFKQALVVTRWSDLGNGEKPMEREWAACNGELDGYDSFEALGKRALSGTFEAAFTHDAIPGQRILSLGDRRGKRGFANPVPGPFDPAFTRDSRAAELASREREEKREETFAVRSVDTD